MPILQQHMISSYIFAAQYPKRCCKTSRGASRLNTLRGTKLLSTVTPKMKDEHSRLCFVEASNFPWITLDKRVENHVSERIWKSPHHIKSVVSEFFLTRIIR